MMKKIILTSLYSLAITQGLFAKTFVQPNIIFIMSDDQGYPPLGINGHPWIKTPNIDDMAHNAVRFDNFEMGSTSAPSRAGIMSGVHTLREGVTHTIYERERLSLSATTIAEVLKPAGYQTGYFGKWHLGDEEAFQPNKRGFDESFIHGAGGIGQNYPGSCADVPGNTYFNPVFRHNGKFVKTQGFCTDVIFESAMGWIKQMHDVKKPFFAYISPNAPHSPFIAPPRYMKRFIDLGFDDKPAGFYGMIEHLDDCMGQLFDLLDEWGIMENTIIIYTSDNGMTRIGCGLNGFDGRPMVKLGVDENGQPMMTYNAGMKGLKGTVDEGGVRAPFIVRWDGHIQKDKVIDIVGCYLDVLPTLADFAGAKLPSGKGFEGRSLKPLILGQDIDWQDRFLFQHVTRWGLHDEPDYYKWDQYSVRNQQYRLVHGKLYDMKNDPEQRHNIAAQHIELVDSMKRAYSKFWNECRPCMVNEFIPLKTIQPFPTEYDAQRKSQGIPDWNVQNINWKKADITGMEKYFTNYEAPVPDAETKAKRAEEISDESNAKNASTLRSKAYKLAKENLF